MEIRKAKPTLAQLQAVVWAFVFLIQMLSMLAMDRIAQATLYALLNTAFYAVIIYGNIYILYPFLYQKGQKILYIATVLAFLTASGLLRAFTSIYLYNLFFSSSPQPVSSKAILSYVLGGFMVFLLSFIFRIALAYFSLKSLTEEILVQKTRAELNLLKSQVQPHFLFNTLNNIYYETYVEAPRTAVLIEQLSGIMRYFVDESPKAVVPLATEINFLENYIALERIRIRYEIDLHFNINADQSLLLPPMLLMTFIENIFKHGIDKTTPINKVKIDIREKDQFLIFSTCNTMQVNISHVPSSGFGLVNLRNRLELLYDDKFELNTSIDNQCFMAILKIPIS